MPITLKPTTLKKRAFIAAVLTATIFTATVAVPAPLLAQSAIKDLYIEAAAAGILCAGIVFDDAEKARLAQVISQEIKETVPAAEVADRLSKATQAQPVAADCKSTSVAIHVDFFNNILLPRLRAVDLGK